MIDIINDKDKLIQSLRELEFNFEKGKISKDSYSSQKKILTDKIDNIEIVNRVKKLQGKGEVERTLDDWTKKKKEDQVVQEENEELMRKYMTSTKTRDLRTTKEKKRGITRNRTILATLLAVIFFSGIAFGFLLINSSSQASAVPMTLNQTAFSTSNHTTNVTNNTNSLNTNTTQTSQSQTTKTNTISGTGSGTNNTTG
jgi:hypothetical protein